MFGKNPNYSSLRIFGCQCFPYLKSQGLNKFSRKTISCVFLGYSPLHKGYRCLDPHTHKVYISRHVVFNESIFPFIVKEQPSSESLQNLSITSFFDEWIATPNTGVQDSTGQDDKAQSDAVNNTSNSSSHMSFEPRVQNCQTTSCLDSPLPLPPTLPNNDETIPQISPSVSNELFDQVVINPPPSPPSQRPIRDRHPPSYLKDYICPTTHSSTNQNMALVISQTEPRTLKTALKFTNWTAAMNEELDALY